MPVIATTIEKLAMIYFLNYVCFPTSLLYSNIYSSSFVELCFRDST